MLVLSFLHGGAAAAAFMGPETVRLLATAIQASCPIRPLSRVPA